MGSTQKKLIAYLNFTSSTFAPSSSQLHFKTASFSTNSSSTILTRNYNFCQKKRSKNIKVSNKIFICRERKFYFIKSDFRNNKYFIL